MKKFFILFSALIMGVQSFGFSPVEIDQKIQKTFDSSFPNAKEVNWLENKNSYEVSFIQNGIRSRVYYPKDNSFVRLTRYFKEENLAYHLRFVINKQFPDKSIFGVTEVSIISDGWNFSSIVYHIILEDEHKYYNVKLDEGGIFTMEKKLKKP
ncbi:MAG: hypothetical protein ACXWV9_01385 [Flavisolibacter sp.]